MQQTTQQESNLFESISALVKSFVIIFSKTFQLARLELKLAIKSFIAMMGLLLISGLLLLSSWFCLLAALCTWIAQDFHLNLPLAILITAAVNLIFAGILYLVIHQLRKNLKFSKTRTQFSRHKEHIVGSIAKIAKKAN